MAVMDIENFLTVEEAAKTSGLSLPTIWARIKDGTIRPVKLFGRTLIPKEAAEGLVDRRRKDGKHEDGAA